MTLKSILAAATFVAVTTAPSAWAATDYAGKYPGYQLAYDENFDDPATLDRNFNFENGYCRNNENQYYRRENASVSNGNLVIKAERCSQFWDGGKKMDFYSSSVKSNARYHYGVWETRAKIPVGPGLWPAIWGTGNTRDWPAAGEIDILEYYNFGLHANVAWGDTWQSPVWDAGYFGMDQFASNFADEYHTWRMEWDHNTIRLYVDDRLLKETKLSRTFNSDGYNPYRDENNGFDIWLNLAIGGDNGGDYSALQEAYYYIDYTRVYTPENTDAALTLRISRAQALLDKYPDAADSKRTALQAAIAAAESNKGKDYDTMDAALDALQSAIDAFGTGKDNTPAGIAAEQLPLNREFALLHEYSNSTLRAGWYQASEDEDKWAKKSLLTIADGAEESSYPAAFTLVKAPGAVDGYNLRTADGSYVYRDRWYLLVTETEPSADTRCTNDYLFTTEKDNDGYIYIKNLGSGKYFGTDNNWSWSRVYSDKEKNERARFLVKYIADDASGFNAGQKYAFEHKATGHLLTAGWHQLEGETEAIKDILLTAKNEKLDDAAYARRFIFVDAPSGAEDDSYYNVRTEFGDYLYCDTWLVKLTHETTPSAADLRSSAYLFRPEKNANGDVLIRSHHSWDGNNYFGTDDTWSWARVFGNKAPEHPNSLFALYDGPITAVNAVESARAEATVAVSAGVLTISGMDVQTLRVYTLTGVPALSVHAATANVSALPRGIYIVEALSADGTQPLRRTVRL